MASSGGRFSVGPQYMDADYVYHLYINRRADDLLEYISSIRGADGDVLCDAIKLTVSALRVPGQERMEPSELQKWANHARYLALCVQTKCGLATPENGVDLTNITSNPGHYGGMSLTNKVPGSHVLKHSPMLNQGSASSLMISPPTSTPLQTNSNDGYLCHPSAGHYMNSFDSSSYAGRMPSSSTYAGEIPSSSYAGRMASSYVTSFDPRSYYRRMFTSDLSGTGRNVVNGPPALPAMLNQPSATNSRILAAPFPCRASSNDVSSYHPRYAAILTQTSASNTRFPAPMFLQENSNNALPLLHQLQPGSQEVTPHELMQNTVSPKGEEQSDCGTSAVGALSLGQSTPEQFIPNGVTQKEQEMVRVRVSSLIAPDDTQGFGGVLIQGNKRHFCSFVQWHFICAICFPIPGPGMKLASAFAAACSEAIRVAQFFNPTDVSLMSDLLYLLQETPPQPEVAAVRTTIRQVGCRVCYISERSNGPACKLALHALQIGRYHIFLQKPDWVVLDF